MIERHSHGFVTSALHSVPRTMERGEDVALVLKRKLVAGVKTQIERCGMRLHKHVWDNDLVGKFRMLSFVARIRVIPNVKPWPAIKAAGTHAADVVRRQVFADLVTFVCAHPEFVRTRTKCDPDSVANAPRVNPLSGAIGIKFEDASTIFFRGFIGNIRALTDRYVHLFAIRREHDVTCPVSTAPQQPARGKMSSQWLRWSTRFEIAITIGKSSYPIGISDVQIVRISPRRIKYDSKWLVETKCTEWFDMVR